MFTGLVEMIGTLTGRTLQGRSGKLLITPARALENPIIGESVAVNGACLTLERVAPNGTLEFHTLAETLKRTNLGTLSPGSMLNLERALKVGDRIGGHFVSGHIDAVGEVLSLREKDDDYELKVSLPEALRGYLVEKGSIAIDGISLTVIEVTESYFTVGIIPVTLRETALAERKSGMGVNLEGDLLGKYVASRLAAVERTGRVSMESLAEAGFLE